VGSENQSRDLISYLSGQFREDPLNIWETNIFGKTLYEMVKSTANSAVFRRNFSRKSGAPCRKSATKEKNTLSVLSSDPVLPFPADRPCVPAVRRFRSFHSDILTYPVLFGPG